MNITLLFSYNSRQTPAKCCCRIYSTQVIHSFHSRTICRVSKILYGSSLLVSLIHILHSRCCVAGSVPGRLASCAVTQPWYFMSYFIVCVFGYRCFPSQTSTRTENIFTVICLSLDGFIWNQHNRSARLVEHCTGVVEVMGSNPAQASVFFFQALFSLLLLTL